MIVPPLMVSVPAPTKMAPPCSAVHWVMVPPLMLMTSEA